ncbi:GtrA family protein [Tardiphaga sp. 367_B4_N1_1]|uniref:GtrA family protein n=1 Tax=Tardiphaga sp. 367_B4_N1_1 TaxID=3240777 RepID=UPI003F1FD06E
MKSFLQRHLGAWATGPTAVKIMAFGVIGLGNTVIDLAVFTFGYQVLGLPLVPANVLAWLIAVSGSYVMNTMVTFRAESGRVLRRKDYFSFVASGILGVIATTTTLVVLSNFIPVYAAKLASILAGFIVNFTMSHFVVFRPKPPTGIVD